MKKKQNEEPQTGRRFSKALYGEKIMRLFRLMPTAKLARLLGLKPRQVSDFAFRNNFEESLGKDSAERSKVASENGKKGGRQKFR